MSKTIGDLTVRQIKEMKKQCENCMCFIDECDRCEKENPGLYALCDIPIDFVDDEDLDKVVEVDD